MMTLPVAVLLARAAARVATEVVTKPVAHVLLEVEVRALDRLAVLIERVHQLARDRGPCLCLARARLQRADALEAAAVAALVEVRARVVLPVLAAIEAELFVRGQLGRRTARRLARPSSPQWPRRRPRCSPRSTPPRIDRPAPWDRKPPPAPPRSCAAKSRPSILHPGLGGRPPAPNEPLRSRNRTCARQRYAASRPPERRPAMQPSRARSCSLRVCAGPPASIAFIREPRPGRPPPGARHR